MADSPTGPTAHRRLLAGISLEYKLPLFISVLLVAVIVLSSGAAYQRMRESAFASARERLANVTTQLTALLQTQTGQMKALIAKAASSDTFTAFFRHPAPPARLNALAAMRRMGPLPDQIIDVELWTAQRERLLTLTPGSSFGAGGQPENVKWAEKLDTAAIGRLQLIGDSLAYPATVLVADHSGPLGYIVEWRRLSTTPQSREVTKRLIGSDALLYIGNDRGDFWTDFIDQVAKPPVDVRGDTSVRMYQRPREGRVIAAARPLGAVPWVVLVEFPLGLVAGPVTVFLRGLVIVDVILVAVALGIAWWIGRRIAAPLRDLTAASAAIAAGDYSRDVSVHRDDEVGQLAATFTTMAHRVRDAQTRLEDQVRERTAKLEERNDELEAFGYSISHDLRAPLRAMQGFSQALLEDCGDRLDAMGREYAERIVAGARRMDELIRDLLAYSRVSRAELKLVRVPLTPVAQSAVAELSGALRARSASVQVDEPLPDVMGHPATLSQVLTNLLGNGLKFVPPGRTPELHVRAERHNGLVRVWVEDNGIGIAPEHQARIFRVFERLHSTDDYPGTGIGLAIVRKAVERMGGQVGVESSLGHGSRFWVELQPAGEEA